MIINLFFISSYSCQLGALVSLIKDNKINLGLGKRHILLIFQLPTKSDNNCKYTAFNEKLLKNYFINPIIFRFKINNLYKRFCLWILLFLSTPILSIPNIVIWQTRPDWIKNIFTLGPVSLPLIIPSRNIKYCGDGFLSLCRSAVPFWLRPKKYNKLKKNILDKNKKNTFYYLYSIDYQKPTIYDIKISKEFIRKIIFEIIDSKKNIKNILFKKKELKKQNKSLLIFPTSTFNETSRCSLDEEINLYLEFINKKIDINSHFICVKPHPRSSKLKTVILEKKLLEIGYELFRWSDYLNLGEVFKIPLDVIPLELFISILVIQLGIKYEKLDLIISSNASLSCFILYPKLNLIYAFSSKLINKYIDSRFAAQRLEQEKFIKKYIKKNFKNR